MAGWWWQGSVTVFLEGEVGEMLKSVLGVYVGDYFSEVSGGHGSWSVFQDNFLS